jgi:uncharacterized protein YkwD
MVVMLAALTMLAAPAAAKKSKAKPRLLPCKNANFVPTRPSQMTRVSLATRCLINRERTRHGLPRLKQNKSLLLASNWQAKDMLDHTYFDHARPDGPAFADRILRFGYASTASGYTIGENIAWASSPIASPRSIVRMWMNSPPHRKNILTRDFRDQAIGALWSDGQANGAYADSGGPFVIFVNQFGRLYGPLRKR